VAVARAVARISLSIALVLGVILSNVAPAAASTSPSSEFAKVFDIAQAKIGDPWVHYAKGPNKFDCVGFVWYAFHENGLQDKIGGYRGVKAYYNWFRDRGLVSTDPSTAKPGDLMIWGDFKHIGMYVGDGQAISALINPWGVKIHPSTGWIPMRVKAYLHTQLSQ